VHGRPGRCNVRGFRIQGQTHVSTGLIALLDDVAGIAKVAAASLDDVAAQAGRAGVKAAGVVIDDAAVTPRYVVGFAAERELPIVWRIAVGSLRNKLIFLLPVALLLGAFAPWLVTPLLMLGGAYLCFEGAEKVYEAVFPHAAHAGAEGAQAVPAKADEDAKVSSAIKTDFILSAEIMAIALASIPEGTIWSKAAALAVVAVGITAGVYGAVAIIVRADDVGVALARNASPSFLGRMSRAVGRGLVKGMPYFLKGLAAVGTAAMVWVGGGIVVHGLEEYGLPAIGHAIHSAAHAAGSAVPSLSGAVEWAVTAAGSGIVGLGLGLALIPVAAHVLAPIGKGVANLRGKAA
jgi:predicted DNA repair protein MutK